MDRALHYDLDVTWIAIAIGGALGSLARHALNHVVHTHWLSSRFPLGIVMVNVGGCFVIGLLAGLLAAERIVIRFYWREFVFVGLLGGFTTFSTFGLDTFLLARTHSPGQAALNVIAQVGGGCWRCGWATTREWRGAEAEAPQGCRWRSTQHRRGLTPGGYSR